MGVRICSVRRKRHGQFSNYDREESEHCVATLVARQCCRGSKTYEERPSCRILCLEMLGKRIFNDKKGVLTVMQEVGKKPRARERWRVVDRNSRSAHMRTRAMRQWPKWFRERFGWKEQPNLPMIRQAQLSCAEAREGPSAASVVLGLARYASRGDSGERSRGSREAMRVMSRASRGKQTVRRNGRQSAERVACLG